MTLEQEEASKARRERRGREAGEIEERDEAGVYQLAGLVVLGVVDAQITHIVAFLDPGSFSSFALPPTLS